MPRRPIREAPAPAAPRPAPRSRRPRRPTPARSAVGGVLRPRPARATAGPPGRRAPPRRGSGWRRGPWCRARAARGPRMVQISSRCSGSSPTVGSSRMSRSGRCSVARAMSTSRRHPPESSPRGLRARWAPSPARSIAAATAARAEPSAQAGEPGGEAQVLLDGEEAVDAGLLEDQAEPPSDGCPLADDVVAEDPGRAAVGRQQRGEQQHRGRLARAVGPEQRRPARRDGPRGPARRGPGRGRSRARARRWRWPAARSRALRLGGESR